MKVICLLIASMAIIVLPAPVTAAQSDPSRPLLPPAFEFYDPDVLRVVDAEGVQIYECRLANDGKLAWSLREPIAVLMSNGTTIGIHSGGPRWSFNNGESIEGKLILAVAAPDANDIPWLKLGVIAHGGRGVLGAAKFVVRTATRGGTLAGPCEVADELRSLPYAAKYIFLR